MFDKVLGYVGVVFGALAILGSLNPIDGEGLVGGILFLALGATSLNLIKKVEKQ